MKFISVLTPTYNRGYIIHEAYESLLSQTDTNFEWVIVDDGSTDDTQKIVQKFIDSKKIGIKYIVKKNGGKHTAINEGLKHVTGDYTIVLDSDDYLKDNAVELIQKYWKKYESNEKISDLSFLKYTRANKNMSRGYNDEIVISNTIDFRHNKKFTGEMCEVYRTDVLKKYPFPVFKGENFLSEAIVTSKMAFDYDTVFINKPIYVADYLPDGLTQNSLITRYKNPIGALENAKLFMDKRFNLKIRMKNSILYSGFSFVAKRKISQIIKNNDYKLLTVFFLPGGVMFNIYISRKMKQGKK